MHCSDSEQRLQWFSNFVAKSPQEDTYGVSVLQRSRSFHSYPDTTNYYVSAFCEGKARFAILVDVVIDCTKKQRQKKDTLQAFSVNSAVKTGANSTTFISSKPSSNTKNMEINIKNTASPAHICNFTKIEREMSKE